MKTRKKTRHSQRRGASLVLTLAILSLLLVGAVAWDVGRRSEDALASAQLHRAAARQNALFALDEAMQALAKHLGDDGGLSARADILVDPQNALWTVAFPATGEAAYLVTGTPGIDEPTEAPAIILVGTASGGEMGQVDAPLVEFADDEGKPAGRFAWWVGDQGIKAQAGQQDTRTSPALFHPQELSEGFIDPQDLLLQSLPGPAHAPEGAMEDGMRVAPEHFHDFAAFNAFTLSNTLDGGLREDLSALYRPGVQETSYSFPLPPGLKEWMHGETPPGTAAQTVAKEDFRLQPVVTEFALRCGLAADKDYTGPGRKPVIFNYHVFVDLWNPYARTLVTGESDVDLIVKVHGLPKVDLGVYSSEVVLPDPMLIELDSFDDMPPGQVQLLSSPTRDAGTSGTGLWQEIVGDAYATDTTLRTLDFSSANVVVEIFDAANPDVAPILTARLTGYNDFRIKYASAPEHRFLRSATTGTINGMSREAFDHGDWAFAYHWRMRGEYGDGSLENWLSESDPRMTEFELQVGTPDPRFEFLEEPTEYEREQLIPEDDFWASRFSAMFRLWDKHAVFFDLPGAQLVSVGMLRHHYWEGHGPYSVGAPGGGEANMLLDRFFFSTLPETARERPPLNGRIVALGEEDGTAGIDSAKGLLLQGGFNINSTSVPAWVAVLGSLRQEKVPMATGGGAIFKELEMGVRLFSLPHGGNIARATETADAMEAQEPENFDATDPPLGTTRRHPSFLVGVRELSEGEIQQLAEEIVSRLKARRRPIGSLSEFADNGLLQEAIDAVPSLNLRHGGRDRIARNSPAHINQGSMIAALAPILSARSDTFLVRTHGASLRQDGRARAQVWLEALVQRMPEAGEEDSAEKRGFEVLSLRWLTAEQL